MTDTTLTDTERDSLTECECGHYLNEHSSDGCLAVDDLAPDDEYLCVCMASPDRIRERAIERIVAARVADRDTWWRERIEARDQEWQRHLDMLPNEMAEAWGGDAAWLTTGSKVATLVGDWLGDLHYDLTPLAAEARTQGGAS